MILNSNTLSDCNKFSIQTTFSTTLLRLTPNVPAAWRSGGLHYRSCGLQTFIFALPFLRGYCRRCAKPPVVGSASFLFSFFSYETEYSSTLFQHHCLVGRIKFQDNACLYKLELVFSRCFQRKR